MKAIVYIKINKVNHPQLISRSSILKRCYCEKKKTDGSKTELEVPKSGLAQIKDKLADLFRPLMTGSKTLWNQSKQVRQIKQAKGKFDIECLNYTPYEYELMISTRKGIIQSLPVMALFWAPVIGYLTPIICMIFPGILPESFFTPQQMVLSLCVSFIILQANFRNERYKVRSSSRQVVENILQQYQISDTTWFHQLSMDNLSRNHLLALSAFHGVGKQFFPDFLLRHLLANKAIYLETSDKVLSPSTLLTWEVLLKYGLSTLTPQQLEQICFDRDVLPQSSDTTPPTEKLHQQLQKWLDIRKGSPAWAWTPSWTLHMIILQQQSKK